MWGLGRGQVATTKNFYNKNRHYTYDANMAVIIKQTISHRMRAWNDAIAHMEAQHCQHLVLSLPQVI